jgi:phage-related tail protein
MTLQDMPDYAKPTAYWTRHSDWYQGTFKDICDAWGGIEAYKFWLEYRERVAQLKLNWGIVHSVSLGLLDPLENFFIGNEVNAYKNQVQNIYDQAAVCACKLFEQLEGVYTNAVNQAKAMVTKVSDYINNNINPLVQKAQADLNNVSNYINNTINPVVNKAKSDIQTLTADANQTIQKINDAVKTLNTHTDQIKDLYTKVGTAAPKTTPILDISKLFKEN